MIRTKWPKKKEATVYEIPITKSRISLPPAKRPKKVTQPDKPEGLRLSASEAWCPYCGRPTVFRHNKFVGIKHCPRCGISDRDFYVRRANKWKS
jgi:hypothetical protein